MRRSPSNSRRAFVMCAFLLLILLLAAPVKQAAGIAPPTTVIPSQMLSQAPANTPTAQPEPTLAGGCWPGLTSGQINLSGTGVVISKIENAERGDPNSIASTAKKAGLSFVIIQVADGTNLSGIALGGEAIARVATPEGGGEAKLINGGVDQLLPVVRALQAVAIRVWGLHYVYGDNPAGEAEIADERIRELGLNGYIVQAGEEYAQAGKSAAAETFMQSLRSDWPRLPIAFSSFRFPSSQPGLPWETFLCQVDLVMPQVYWVQARNPDEQLTRSVSEYSQFPVPRRIVPIGTAFSETGWRPSANEISLFRSTAGNLGLNAIGFYSWDYARSRGNEDLWDAISGVSNWPVYSQENDWLPANDIQALAFTRSTDKAPTLLVATDRGVTLIDGRTSRDWATDTDKALPAKDILVYANRFAMAATDDGIWAVDLENGKSARVAQEATLKLGLSSDEQLWALGQDGLRVYDLRSFNLGSLGLVMIYTTDVLGIQELQALAVTSNQTWVGGGSQLVRIDRATGASEQITPVPLHADLASATRISALVFEAGKGIWVGTNSGGGRWDGGAWQEVFGETNGLASENVNDIAIDAVGGVWFATDAGAIRYDQAQKTWHRYIKSIYPVIPSDTIRNLLIDPDGTVWLGTDAGLAGLQGQSSAITVFQHDGRGPASNKITALLEDGSLVGREANLWVGTLDAGVSVRLAGTTSGGSGGAWRYFDRDTSRLPDHSVTALLSDALGQVWVGTAKGVAVCTPNGCSPPTGAATIEEKSVRAMALDAQGFPWIGTSQGLFWCHPDCEANPSLTGAINLLARDSAGNMWVVTEVDGTYTCQGMSCQVNNSISSLVVGMPLFPPVTLLPDTSGKMLVVDNNGRLLLCDPETCENVFLDIKGVNEKTLGLAFDSQGNLWVLSTSLEYSSSATIDLLLCRQFDCQRTPRILPNRPDLPNWLPMRPGPSGDMWILVRGAGIYYCARPGECQPAPTTARNVTQALPEGDGWALIGDQVNGLQRCSVGQCEKTPATGIALEAYQPGPNQPWVRLTSNATLFGPKNILLDVSKIQIEFEGGSLTTPSLDLSYLVTLRDEDSAQIVIQQSFARGAIGSASPGQVTVGEITPLDYHTYLLEITAEEPRGQKRSYTQRFELQASPIAESITISTGSFEASFKPTQPQSLPDALSYSLRVDILDFDSKEQPFTVECRWLTGQEPDPPWQILVKDQKLEDGPIEGKIEQMYAPENVTALSIRITDADGNRSEWVTPVTLRTLAGVWISMATFVLGVFTVASVGFYGLARYSSLPVKVLARQGRHILTVGPSYRRFHQNWREHTLFERLLLLLIPPDKPFKLEEVSTSLKEREIPAEDLQIEHTLHVLVMAQLIKRSGDIYHAIEPALIRALQAHEGIKGIEQLSQEVRSENPLFADALRFFTTAGFVCNPLPDRLAFACTPALPSWQSTFVQAVYARVFVGAPIDRKDVIRAQEEAQEYPDLSHKVIFAIVDHTPSDSAWLQIGTLRAEDVQVIPIDDTVVQSGREHQKEREGLQAHLRRFLGRRRDLYNVRDPVADRLNFFGREAQSNELMETISEGRPVLLLALRKMGKSSVLLFLRDKAPFPVAHVDLQAGSELAGLYGRILESWKRSLRMKFPNVGWEMPDLTAQHDLNESELSTTLSQAANNLMRALENAGYTPRLGIFIDEIEVITPRESLGTAPQSTLTTTEGSERPEPQDLERYLNFARTLRGLLQESGNLALLAVGVDPKVNRITRWGVEQNPFYQFFREEYLGPLSQEDCIQMVRNIGQQMGLAYTDDAVELVAQASGGHPFLARQLCSLLVRELSESAGGTIALEQVHSAAERFVRDPNTETLLNERGMWGEVSNPELWPAAQINENQDILTMLAKSEALSEADLLAAGRDEAARQRSLFELSQRSVLSKWQELLRIQFGLFRNWIRQYKLGGG